MSYIHSKVVFYLYRRDCAEELSVIIRTRRKRPAMSIIYSLVSRGTTVLVDYTETTGNFQQITGSILQKIPLHNDTKCTYVSGRLVFIWTRSTRNRMCGS